jgi:hypothetical protein
MKIGSASTWLGRIGITTLAWAGMVARTGFDAAAAAPVLVPVLVPALAMALAAACGASAREARSARARAYDADYTVVYNQVVAAVAAEYPDFLAENAAEGEIRTPWFPLGLVREPGTTGTSRRGIEDAPRRFYIRFDIEVTGPRPWRVHVRGQASAWELGQPQPEVLDGPEEPPWLQGRIDALQIAIHERLARHAVAAGPPEPGDPERDPKRSPDPDAEPAPAYLADLPAGAARAALAVQRAAESRDFDALARLLADQVTWSPGAPPDARTALGVWRADPAVLAHLAAAIAGGCRAAPAGARPRVVCPAAAAEPGFAGYRAELAPSAGDRWRLTAFFTR